MHGKIKTTIFTLIFSFCLTNLFAIESNFEPSSVEYFRRAYPDITFTSSYNNKIDDWIIHISAEKRTIDLVWAEGRLLPQEKLSEKNKYEKLIYWYPDKAYDPATFTEKTIENIKKVTSSEYRKNNNITPPFFFDFIYQSKTQATLEKHIESTKFFGFRLNLHKRSKETLK